MSISLFNLSMASSTPTRPSLEIISLNCHGLRSTDHRETLFSWLNCCKVDFLCLQETHSISEAEFTSWLKSAKDDDLLTIDYNCLSSPGSNQSYGVAILYRSEYTVSSCSRNQAGRLLCAEFPSSSDSFQICTIYGPNNSSDGDRFLESLYQILNPDMPLTLCGDFNTFVDPVRDRRGCNPISPWSRQWSRTIVDLISTFDLHDIWRRFNPDTTALTWHRPNKQ